jgi:putative ubiquitin-RnfH superfamily antitoxin RatB of RatAB toxin-antitoxin module
MDNVELINIEVAYAKPEEQVLIPLSVANGTPLQEAIELSGILLKFPEIELGKKNRCGIFSKPAKLDTPLRNGDRVEIYRPLIADPKAVRKKRAEEGKVTKKGGGEAAL